MQVIGSVVKVLDKREPRKRPKTAPPKSRRKVHLTEAQLQDLLASYTGGSTIVELAAQFDISRTTVSKHLRQHGVSIRLKGLGDKEIALAIDLYRSGLSVARVAERVGCAPNTFRAELLAAGVKMRDTHGN
jgi:transposase-like protein